MYASTAGPVGAPAVLPLVADASSPGELALTLWLRGAPVCPVCSHRSRMWRLVNLFAWRCRWGHVVAEPLDEIRVR